MAVEYTEIPVLPGVALCNSCGLFVGSKHQHDKVDCATLTGWQPGQVPDDLEILGNGGGGGVQVVDVDDLDTDPEPDADDIDPEATGETTS